jgi:hypothetical protein
MNGMKKMSVVVFASFLSYITVAQYVVTKVIGSVKNKSTGEMLKMGNKLTDDDVIVFSSVNDMVRVIVAGKGVYIISPGEQQQNQSSEIVEMLKTALHVKYKEGYLSGRSSEEELIPDVFEKQEAVNNKNLFGNTNKYVFDERLFGKVKGRFFLQIESPGSTVTIHPLRTSADTLIIYAADFQTDKNADRNKVTYKLGFFDKEKNSSQSLALVQPYIDSTGEMETLLKIIIEQSKGGTSEQIRNTCYSEVYAALGKPSWIDFKSALDYLMRIGQKNK